MLRRFACLNDKRMPAHFLISLLELAEQYQVEPERLLRGSRLFQHDLISPSAQVAPLQFLYVLKKLRRELAEQPQLALELGQRIASGHEHFLFQLWCYAPNLHQALTHWQKCQHQVETLLQLHLERQPGKLYLRLTESASLGAQQRFFYEAALAALRLLLKEQLGTTLWMQIELPWSQPSQQLHHPAYLGDTIRFDAPRCAIVLPESALYQPFKEASPLRFARARQAARKELNSAPLLQSYLRRQVRNRLAQSWSLDDAAQQLGMSPATLKRRLKQDGTSYKQLTDEVKGEEALHLMAFNQWNNSQLASQMAFADEHSFRRAFKRWTGRVPSAFRCS